MSGDEDNGDWVHPLISGLRAIAEIQTRIATRIAEAPGFRAQQQVMQAWAASPAFQETLRNILTTSTAMGTALEGTRSSWGRLGEFLKLTRPQAEPAAVNLPKLRHASHEELVRILVGEQQRRKAAGEPRLDRNAARKWLNERTVRTTVLGKTINAAQVAAWRELGLSKGGRPPKTGRKPK